MSLRKKAFSGLVWTFSQQFSVQAINFIVQLILARILLPEDFGLIAMIQIFIAIGQVLMDGGMTSSLIRSQEANQRDYSTVFFINMIFSVLIYIILYLTAPYIAGFFDQEILVDIIRVLTLTFVIQALVGVQTTILTKEMNFKLQMFMQLPSTLIGGATGIILAWAGYGVWSLVWMKLVTSALFMLQHWFRTEWKPQWIFDKSRFRHHFNFGYKLTLSGLLTTLYTNSYLLLIGKMFPPAQLGFYTQANNLRMFPVRNLTAALQKVTYPLFSSIQDDNHKLKSVFRKITGVVFFIVVPIMLLLTLIAKPLFSFILTDKWLPAVPYFQILAVIAIIYPLSIYNLNIILVKGQSGLHLKLEVFKKLGSVVFLLLIIPFGVLGVVYAQAISMLIHAGVNIYYSGKEINYSMISQLKDLSPILALGSVTFLSSFLIDFYFLAGDISDLHRILINTLIFTSLYLALSFFIKLRALIDLKTLISQDLMKKLRR